MLVLGRRKNQKVVITVGEVEIVVTLIDAFRLGFDAPKHVTIEREEVRDRNAGAGVKSDG